MAIVVGVMQRNAYWYISWLYQPMCGEIALGDNDCIFTC